MSWTALERAAIALYVKTIYSEEIDVSSEEISFPGRYSESDCNNITIQAFLASDIVHKRLKIKTRSLFQDAVEKSARFVGVQYMGKTKGYYATFFHGVSERVDYAFAKRCKEIADAENNAERKA